MQTNTSPLRAGTLTLGWLSLGLGLAEIVAPRRMAHWIGLSPQDDNLRLKLVATGVREVTCGLGLISQKRPATWAWARTAGDLLDLALIGTARPSRNGNGGRALGAAASVLGAAAIDAAIAIQLTRHARSETPKSIAVTQSVTISRTPADVYAFFRDFTKLPSFMSHLELVQVHGRRSHWRTRGPLGTSVEWDAEIVEDRPGEVIAWRSLDGAEVPNRGRVQFAPLHRRDSTEIDTEMIVELVYEPPAGALGAVIAKLFGEEPHQQISADLRRVKQMLETGEVLHSDASIHRGTHPARPANTTWKLTEDGT